MSKITFRADDDLVEELEMLELSKSEAMREALRSYLAETSDAQPERSAEATAIDDLVRDRVDSLLAARLDELRFESDTRARQARDVTVTVSLEGDEVQSTQDSSGQTRTNDGERSDPDRISNRDGSQAETQCGQCGEYVDDDHVYCPNCGEKASHRLFCECGDEIRSDWSFCPSCGRRTPAADVLESK
ncbi:double zinc ribbon domain-containing protein [Natrialbaceae archaeon A-arb3/5]